MHPLIRISLGVAGLCLASVALAQKPIVYPAKGQGMEQQNKDDGECYVWAKQNTGIDPLSPPPAAPAQTSSTGGGERVRGALRGAVGGAIIGEIASDDAGKGAGIGAVLGTMRGGHEARQKQQAQQQQAQGQQQAQVNTFYRAYGACMEGRGYTIK